MVDLDRYDQVVSQIYEAALVPARWDVVLTTMINLFGPREWEVAFIIWECLDPPMGRFIGSAGVHDLARSTYLAHFAGRQEWSRLGHAMPVGRVFHSDELLPRPAFRQTEFFQRFLGPWGFEVALIGNLDRQGRNHLGIVCPGPPEGDHGELLDAMRRLTPHFQRAARISRRIGEADMRAATATAVLDASPYCVLALGPGLELLHANSQAAALLDGAVRMPFARHLSPDHPGTLATLRAMAAGVGPERSLTFTATGRQGERMVFSALAVRRDQADQFFSGASGAALILVGGQRMRVRESDVEALQAGFGLTAAEARLAGFLLEGSGIRGYADYRGVSLEAGKYLLKGIYAKTGVSNQTELVAMLREAPLGWGRPLPEAPALSAAR